MPKVLLSVNAVLHPRQFNSHSHLDTTHDTHDTQEGQRSTCHILAMRGESSVNITQIFIDISFIEPY